VGLLDQGHQFLLELGRLLFEEIDALDDRFVRKLHYFQAQRGGQLVLQGELLADRVFVFVPVFYKLLDSERRVGRKVDSVAQPL
jgi:hypothetical protein